MIEGNCVKIVKGIQKIDFSPEEARGAFFIIREFNDNLNIMCQNICDPQINICFYDNQLCFLINALYGTLTLDLSKFLAKKNLKIVPCNSLSKNTKDFIEGDKITIFKGYKKAKENDCSNIIIRDFNNYINISTSIATPEINIVLYNHQLILSLGSGSGNFTIDLSGFLANNNLKIAPVQDNKNLPEITDIEKT